MTNDDYRIEPVRFDRGSLEQVSQLLRLVFPKVSHLTPRYLEWLYAANPDGEAVACNAFAGETLVGHLGASAMTARIDGEMRRGLLLLNSAVHPQHRRRHLMSRLSETIFPIGASRAFGFCISTGNRYSTRPLLTRFRMLRPLEARIGLGLPRRRLRSFVPSFERIWSGEALRWRLANPESGYTVQRAGAGIAVAAPTGLRQVSAILYDGPGDLPPGGDRSGGAVRVWLGLDPDIEWRRSAYLPIPQWLRPSPLNLLFRDLSGDNFLPQPDRLVFRGLDFDAY